MPFPVPNGKRTFLDLNGDPLAAGQVFFYVPGTSDPSPTYADEGMTVPNTNPVVLDQAGRAVIWGDGLYREVVYDLFGNLIWDQTTGIVIDNIPGNLTVGGNLTVDGNTQLNGSANVSGPLSAQDGLGVNGGATINGGLNTDNINNSGNINTNTLDANGITDNGNLAVGGSLTVTGPSNLNGGLTTSSLHDTGNAQIDGDLAVGGNETVAGNLHVGGTITGGGTGTNPMFPPGSGGDYIVSMQLLWGSFQTQSPTGPGPPIPPVESSNFHQPYGRLAQWYVLITTAQGRQFTFLLSPSDYPTVPYEADTFTPIQFPPNGYIRWGVYPPDQSGANEWVTEVMPDGSWINWVDFGSGGTVWGIQNQGAAGVPNNNPNGPMGDSNPPYEPWPFGLWTGYSDDANA